MVVEKQKFFVLIDSSGSEAELTANHLESILDQYHAKLIVFSDGAEALDYIVTQDEVSLVISEYRLEGMGGLQLISEINAKKPQLPSVMLSGHADATVAIKAVQAGAYDFLAKPCTKQELVEVINEALIEDQQVSSLSNQESPQAVLNEPLRLVGKSRAMSKVYRDLAKLAATPVTVLIRGETGTGKELIALALHEHGHRAHKPFIAVNCAAIPDNLLESELFGHEKGAFTGANTRKIGRFEQAQGATLFLDEIGDMKPLLQAKMLRVLQERVIQRIGGKDEIPVDVRIIAATHRNLGQMVEDGAFRADLFFRLNGSTLRLPPLRDRLGDVSALTRHFLGLFGRELGIESPRITPEALSYLASQSWPGNVRQLQNVLRQAILKRRGLTISATDLKSLVSNESLEDDKSVDQLASSVIEKAKNGELSNGAYREMITYAEKSLLHKIMKETDGNQSKAAELLGITRYTLREKLKALEILF